MLQTLYSLLVLIIMAPVRASQVMLALWSESRHKARYQVLKRVHERSINAKKYSLGSEQSDLGVAAYMVYAQNAARAIERRARAKSAFLDRAALTGWFAKGMFGFGTKNTPDAESKNTPDDESRSVQVASRTPLRWLGFTSLFSRGPSLVDVAVVLVAVATLYPGMLHYGVNVLNRVGTGVVTWVTGTAQDAAPSIQEFLKDQVLGMGSESAKEEVVEEPPKPQEVAVDEPEFIQVVRIALQGTDPTDE